MASPLIPVGFAHLQQRLNFIDESLRSTAPGTNRSLHNAYGCNLSGRDSQDVCRLFTQMGGIIIKIKAPFNAAIFHFRLSCLEVEKSFAFI
jgi:hypothetical protein